LTKELHIIGQKLLGWGRCAMFGTKTQPSIAIYQMSHWRIPPLGTFTTHTKQRIDSIA